ncbi:MAG: peptide deformylase [Planctomycetota bacterium]|jgi:peptide deformylase
MSVDAAQLQILHYPAAVLRAVAEPIDTIDETVAAVAARMLDLMHEADGAGLAAPQVGLSQRLFVTKAADRRPGLVYINPRLSELDPEIAVREEGCLSLPAITAEVRRPASATMTALDLEGREFTLRDDGLLARVWQHEVDHLNGVLIIDKMTPMDRITNRRPLKDLEAVARM